MPEKPLTINMSKSAQQTYSDGSLRLHELVVEKNGKLDPEGVKVALKIVEGMTGSPEKKEKLEWDMRRFYRWAQEELEMDRKDAVAWVHLHVQLSADLNDEKEEPNDFLFFDGDLNLEDKPKLKTFPPFKMIKGNLRLNRSENLKLPEGLDIRGDLVMIDSKIQALPRLLQVMNGFYCEGSHLKKIGDDSSFGPTGLKKIDEKYWFNVVRSSLREIPESIYINVDLIAIDEDQFALKQQLEKLTQSKRVKGRIIVK